ncbi:MAG: outer membrane protein assembly factor BamE [Gammaproteobacteria bacterium]|nr:outer membrane protein assembly factor BamE [Gammaproteobacteria bacterium]
MQKLLIPGVIVATLLATGCSTVRDTTSSIGDVIPNSLARTSLFYKIDVQQGNSIDQLKVSRLEPGMSKNQAQFIMGTPILVDVFHQDRWDYYYSMQRGNGESEQKHIALFFKDDRLVRTEGDVRPKPIDDMEPLQEAEVFSVPDYNDTKGIFSRMIEKISYEDE